MRAGGGPDPRLRSRPVAVPPAQRGFALGPALMLLMGAGLALFLLLWGGRVHVIACQLDRDAQCVVQELGLGLHEWQSRQIVGVRRVEVTMRTTEYTDDDGRRQTSSQPYLALLDLRGREVDGMWLAGDAATAKARAWAALLDRGLATGDDSLPRLWFANVAALVAGTVLWVGLSCGLLGVVLQGVRFAVPIVLGLAAVQLVALVGLTVFVHVERGPPPDWPGLALPLRLPDAEG